MSAAARHFESFARSIMAAPGGGGGGRGCCRCSELARRAARCAWRRNRIHFWRCRCCAASSPIGSPRICGIGAAKFLFGLVSFRLKCTRAIIVRSLLRFPLPVFARLVFAVFGGYIGFLLLLRRVRCSLFCPFCSVSIFRDGRAKESLWFDFERIRSYRAPAMA